MRIVFSFLVFFLCIVIAISFENQNADTKKALNINTTNNFSHYISHEYPASDPSGFRIAAATGALFLSNGGKIEEGNCGEPYDSLEYDFYRDSCPQAEGSIRAMVWYLRKSRSGVAPAFLRLVFRDCSIEAGGPFNPLYIGSRDSRQMLTFAVSAMNADLSTFELREMSSLCRRALKAVVVIAIIYYVLGSQPQQIYMGQNGAPVRDQGHKRKTEPTLRELLQQLHSQKRQ